MAVISKILLSRSHHLLRQIYLRLRLNHAVLFLKLLSEWVLWVQICHKLLQLFHLELERFGGFEVFALDRLFLPLLQHIEVTAN